MFTSPGLRRAHVYVLSKQRLSRCSSKSSSLLDRMEPLGPELLGAAVQPDTLSRQGVHNVRGDNCLAPPMLRVLQGVSEKVGQERLHDKLTFVMAAGSETPATRSHGESTMCGLRKASNLLRYCPWCLCRGARHLAPFCEMPCRPIPHTRRKFWRQWRTWSIFTIVVVRVRACRVRLLATTHRQELLGGHDSAHAEKSAHDETCILFFLKKS